MKKMYDVLIIGGGVAGMTAAIYAKRRGKAVAIIEKYALGGQVNTLSKIENFPSQPEIDGYSLSQMFSRQLKKLDISIVYDEINKVDFSEKIKVLFGKSQVYKAESVIIATGMKPVEIGSNEMEYFGKGVSFCAVCDANFYKNKPVCVASHKGSGIAGAVELAGVCSKVTVLDSGDMSKFAQANKNAKIEVVSKVDIKKIEGELKLEKIITKVNGENKIFQTDALFVELGKRPSTQLYVGVLDLDEKGFIKTDENMHTSIAGVFAIGDVRSGFLKQIVTACSDGAIAGQLA